ncbi:MAG: hypothetical protein ABFS45_25620 [Pseudomonadota bacterium]
MTYKYIRDKTGNPLRGMRQRLAWALGIATGLVAILIIAAVQLGASVA